MGFVVVVLSELGYVVEFWVVEFECLPEPFNLSLRCRFSSGIYLPADVVEDLDQRVRGLGFRDLQDFIDSAFVPKVTIR